MSWLFVPLIHPNTVGTWTHTDTKLSRDISVTFLNIPLFTHQSKTTDSQLSEMVYRKSARGQRHDLNDHLGPSYFLTKQQRGDLELQSIIPVQVLSPF